MSSSNLSSQVTVQSNSSPRIGQSRKRTRPAKEGCKARNRRLCDLLDLEGGKNSSNEHLKLPPSVKIRCVYPRVLYVPVQSLKDYPCPAPSCFKGYQRLQYLNRHIRGQEDDAHKELAKTIDETTCTLCAKKFMRPSDLVKHEKHEHWEPYKSRLDRVSGLPSPPPESTGSDHAILHDHMPASESDLRMSQPLVPFHSKAPDDIQRDHYGGTSNVYSMLPYDRSPRSSSDLSATMGPYPQTHSNQFPISSSAPIATTAACDSPIPSQIKRLTIEALEIVRADLENGQDMDITMPNDNAWKPFITIPHQTCVKIMELFTSRDPELREHVKYFMGMPASS